MRFFAKNDQINCWDCGRRFAPDAPVDPDADAVFVRCPNLRHNRGTVWQRDRDGDHPVPVDVD